MLFISHTAQIGGAEISLILLLMHINRENFCPLVVLPTIGPLADRLDTLGIEIIILPLNRLRWRNPLPYIWTVYKLVKLIKVRKINLVQTNIEPANQYGVVAAWLAGIPCVAHIRNIQNRRRYWEHFLALSKVCIANSHATARSLRSVSLLHQRIEVIHNGVDLEVFDPLSVDRSHQRKRLNISSKTFLIGVAGRISPEKRQHLFLESFAKVVDTNTEMHALLIGDTSADGNEWYLEDLYKRVVSLGLEKKVTFTGFTEDMPGMYYALDLLVLPSVAEPFGRTLIEAMAMERPVIATRAGGAVEVVDDGVTGILVTSENSDELADAIQWASKNRDIANKMGIKGRERAESLFAIKENVKKIELVYQNILKH